jgi:hypothetical protein
MMLYQIDSQIHVQASLLAKNNNVCEQATCKRHAREREIFSRANFMWLDKREKNMHFWSTYGRIRVD